MAWCQRCGVKCVAHSNYCHHCGAPMKAEILKLVRDSYEEKRQNAVHSVLSVLMKQDCIKKEKLDMLMEKLSKMF
jgi:hypothetical protein